MRYLSDAWIDAAAEALEGHHPAPSLLGIGYLVKGGPDGQREHTVVVGPEGATVRPGLVDADLIFELDWEVATQIAQGRFSAQRAFLDGDIILDGDTTALLDLGSYWPTVQDRLVQLRSVTEY